MRIYPKIIDCISICYAHNSSAYRFLVYDYKIPYIYINTTTESRNDMCFCINPMKGQVLLNKHERLPMRVVRTKNKNKRLKLKRLRMNLDVAKGLK